jgi:hypothetical protein
MKTSIKTSCKRVLLALFCICGSQVQAKNTISWSQFSAPLRANTQIKKSFSRKVLTWGGVGLATAVIAYVLLTKVRAHKQGPDSSCWEIMKNDWRRFTGLFSKRPIPAPQSNAAEEEDSDQQTNQQGAAQQPAPVRVDLNDQADAIIATLVSDFADALAMQEVQELLKNPALSLHKAQELRAALQQTEKVHPQEAAQQQNTHNQQTAQKENVLSFADIKYSLEELPLTIYAETDKKRLKDRIARLMQSASEGEKAQMTTWLQKLNGDNSAETIASKARADYDRLSKIAENLGGLENDDQRAEARKLIPLLESEDDKNTVRGWL